MSMRTRQKSYRSIYPKWSRQDSPARQAKKRDDYTCITCGTQDRTLILDADGQPHHILYLHAAHLHYLDPMYWQVEQIEGQKLRAMCPACHRRYDIYWRDRAEECEHQVSLHGILLTGWFAKRFSQVL